MPSVESARTAPSPEPATYFMLIDGLNGGSTDSQHKGWFETLRLRFRSYEPIQLIPKAGPVVGKPNSPR